MAKSGTIFSGEVHPIDYSKCAHKVSSYEENGSSYDLEERVEKKSHSDSCICKTSKDYEAISAIKLEDDSLADSGRESRYVILTGMGLFEMPMTELMTYGTYIIHLDVSGNCLSGFPKEFVSFFAKSLKVLKAACNNIKNLPFALGYMEKLEELDLSFNLIETIPSSFGRFRCLRILNLQGNPLLPWVIEICGRADQCWSSNHQKSCAKLVVIKIRQMELKSLVDQEKEVTIDFNTETKMRKKPSLPSIENSNHSNVLLKDFENFFSATESDSNQAKFHSCQSVCEHLNEPSSDTSYWSMLLKVNLFLQSLTENYIFQLGFYFITTSFSLCAMIYGKRTLRQSLSFALNGFVLIAVLAKGFLFAHGTLQDILNMISFGLNFPVIPDRPNTLWEKFLMLLETFTDYLPWL